MNNENGKKSNVQSLRTPKVGLLILTMAITSCGEWTGSNTKTSTDNSEATSFQTSSDISVESILDSEAKVDNSNTLLTERIISRSDDLSEDKQAQGKASYSAETIEADELDQLGYAPIRTQVDQASKRRQFFRTSISSAIQFENNLELSFFDELSVKPSVRIINRRDEHSFTWVGKDESDDTSLVAILVDDQNELGKLILGTIYSQGRVYEINTVSMEDEIYIIKEVDSDTKPGCGTDTPSTRNEFTSLEERNLGIRIPNNDYARKSHKSATSGTYTIDVMVLYTEEARCDLVTSFAGDASCPTISSIVTMNRKIQLQIDVANEIFNNSQTNIQLNLVDTMELVYTEEYFNTIYTEAGHYLDYIERKLNDNGSRIAKARINAGADLVSLIVKNSFRDSDGHSICGMANRKTMPLIGDANYTSISLVDSNCLSGETFTHEIGHNLGASHDRYSINIDNPSYNSVYGFNYGYINAEEGIRTIMSYDTKCDDKNTFCPRVPYFSNPDISLNDVTIGKTKTDNARMIDFLGPLVSFYML
jgi:hypothetical protein